MTDSSRFRFHELSVRSYSIRAGQHAILLLAFALRVFRLDFQELRGDEVFGYFFSLRTYDDMISSTLSLGEPHPVGSYFLQHVWLSLAGHSEFALRFVSVWFGLLAVVLLYKLARRLGFSTTTASVAMVLLAISPYAVWHSQDARMYSILMALTLASTWLMIEALQRGRWPIWFLYVAVSWLALHTHYFAIFVLVAQNCFVLGRALLMPQIRFSAAQWVQWQFVLGFFYMPWLFTASETLTGYGGNGDSPSFLSMIQRSLAVFAIGESVPTGWRTSIAVAAGALLLFGGIRLWREGANRRRTLFLLLLLWAVPVLATWLSAHNRPIFNERYLIAAAPPFYLLVAAAMTHTIRNTFYPVRYLPSIILVALFSVSLSYHFFHPNYSKTRGWRELAATFERFSADIPTQQVRLAQNFPDPTIWYYYTGSVDHIVLPPQANDSEGAADVVARLATAGVTRVLLPVQPAAWWDGFGIGPKALAQQYALTVQLPVGVWPLAVYSRVAKDWVGDEHSQSAVDFVNGVRLEGVILESETFVPGGVMVAHLRWDTGAAVLKGRESVFLHLLDGAGEIVGQIDVPLQPDGPADGFTAYGILLPDNAPAGPYRLIGGLYDPSLPGAPRVDMVNGGDFVALGVLK